MNLNNSRVYNGTISWVKAILVLLHKQTMLDVAVDQAVEDLGLISWGRILEQVSDHLDLMFLDFSCHCWASHAISINDDLLGKSLSIFLIIAHGIVDEALEGLSSFSSDK